MSIGPVWVASPDLGGLYWAESIPLLCGYRLSPFVMTIVHGDAVHISRQSGEGTAAKQIACRLSTLAMLGALSNLASVWYACTG